MAADGAALRQRLRAGCSYPARGWERYKERAFAGAHCRRDGDHEKRMPPHILCGGISVRQNIRRILLIAAEYNAELLFRDIYALMRGASGGSYTKA